MIEDEFVLDTPVMRHFIGEVRTALDAAPPAEALESLRPAFAALLADKTWLPEQYQGPAPSTGMGGASATWLLYRASADDLSLSVLVLPPGAATPIHDHLAWGIVGLYAGTQDEEVYARHEHGDAHDHVPLELVESNSLQPGDFYVLLPPEGDIHRVVTTSSTPSVSIHLLGNNVGCVWRHSYTLEDNRMHPFRSGWSNAPCDDGT